TAFLAPGHPTLRFLEVFFSLAVVARILHRIAFARDEKYLQPNSDTRLASGGWQGVYGHLSTGKADVPAIRLVGDGDGLGGALQRTTPAHPDAPNLGEHQEAIVQRRPIAKLLVGEAAVAVRPLETGIAGLFARLHTAEECLERAIQP